MESETAVTLEGIQSVLPPTHSPLTSAHPVLRESLTTCTYTSLPLWDEKLHKEALHIKLTPDFWGHMEKVAWQFFREVETESLSPQIFL